MSKDISAPDQLLFSTPSKGVGLVFPRRLPGWILVLVVALFGCACQKKEVQPSEPQRFVEMFIRFLTPENEYKAQVMFLEGDSLGVAQPKKLPGGLSWDGNPMREKNVSSNVFRYEYIKSGPYDARHRFAFTDENGARRTLSAEMSPVVQFRLGPSLSQNTDAVLTIEGKPLAEGEVLLVLFTDEQGTSEKVSFPGPSVSNTFTIPQDMLARLQPGTHEVYLIKQQQKERIQHRYKVFSTIEWYSPVVEVTLVR